jgi:hypothetical protein
MSEAQHVQAVLDAGLVTEGPRHTPDQQQAHRILAQNFTSDQTGIQIRLDREQHPDQEHAAPLTPHLQHQDQAGGCGRGSLTAELPPLHRDFPRAGSRSAAGARGICNGRPSALQAPRLIELLLHTDAEVRGRARHTTTRGRCGAWRGDRATPLYARCRSRRCARSGTSSPARSRRRSRCSAHRSGRGQGEGPPPPPPQACLRGDAPYASESGEERDRS